ncbi:MAG TPA: putative bifunctional diguanylate cyclase/phosphodiesterase, partial [Candidatus Brocadiaceae bacterium]
KQDTNTLRNISEQTDDILDSISDAFIVVNCEWCFTYVNSAAERLLSFKRDELIGMCLWKVLTEAIGTTFEKEFHRAISEKVTVRIEGFYPPLNAWFDVSAFPSKHGLSIYFRDITDHKWIEIEQRESEIKFRTVFENVIDGILIADITTKRLLMCNSSICKMLGYTLEEIQSLEIKDIHIEHDLPSVLEQFEKLASQVATVAPNIPVKRKDGRILYADITCAVITFEGKLCFLGIFRDVSDRKQHEEKIQYMAFHDSLTNLPNRKLFNDRLSLALTHARRTKELVAVLFLDLDRFKVINDTLGHTVGDELLRVIANRLRTCVRKADSIARLGGDEFTVLLPGITHTNDVNTIVHKICEVIKQPWVTNGHELYVTVSVGISLYPNDGEDADTLLKNADMAMYHAKEHGRNNYHFFNSAMHTKSIERMALESDLRRALERKEFLVYYQPLIDIITRRIAGLEALVRWQHPVRGIILPHEFLSLAEETRLITFIDEWVLETACLQNKAWQNANFPPLCVSVNLSAHTFQKENLVEIVTSVLKKTGLAPQYLGLEITEHVAMRNLETTIHKLGVLKNLGIQIAIDDFGTGFSCLCYLKNFPINQLKISEHFVKGIAYDQNDQVIVKSVIDMTHGMKYEVVAEGVETDSQFQFLKELRCNRVQGHLFSKPLSAGEFGKTMAQDNPLCG